MAFIQAREDLINAIEAATTLPSLCDILRNFPSCAKLDDDIRKIMMNFVENTHTQETRNFLLAYAPWRVLPVEIQAKILGTLDLPDLLKAMSVSSGFHSMITNPSYHCFGRNFTLGFETFVLLDHGKEFVWERYKNNEWSGIRIRSTRFLNQYDERYHLSLDHPVFQTILRNIHVVRLQSKKSCFFELPETVWKPLVERVPFYADKPFGPGRISVSLTMVHETHLNLPRISSLNRLISFMFSDKGDTRTIELYDSPKGTDIRGCALEFAEHFLCDMASRNDRLARIFCGKRNEILHMLSKKGLGLRGIGFAKQYCRVCPKDDVAPFAMAAVCRIFARYKKLFASKKLSSGSKSGISGRFSSFMADHFENSDLMMKIAEELTRHPGILCDLKMLGTFVEESRRFRVLNRECFCVLFNHVIGVLNDDKRADSMIDRIGDMIAWRSFVSMPCNTIAAKHACQIIASLAVSTPAQMTLVSLNQDVVFGGSLLRHGSLCDDLIYEVACAFRNCVFAVVFEEEKLMRKVVEVWVNVVSQAIIKRDKTALAVCVEALREMLMEGKFSDGSTQKWLLQVLFKSHCCAQFEDSAPLVSRMNELWKACKAEDYETQEILKEIRHHFLPS